MEELKEILDNKQAIEKQILGIISEFEDDLPDGVHLYQVKAHRVETAAGGMRTASIALELKI